jgi:FkbM family methyltransferase
MKYQIIVPTFIGHLPQIELFLSSFDKFCLDKESINLHLVISRPERNAFKHLEDKYKNRINLNITDLFTLLKTEEKVEINEKDLLQQVGKFNYQSLKKIYAIKHFTEDMGLVLDSEALLIRPTRFTDIFENYRKNRFIVSANPGLDETKQDVARLSFELLGMEYKPIWFFEYYYWFFDKKIVDEMFVHVLKTTGRTLYENLLFKKPLFEYNLYALFSYFYHKEEFTFLEARHLISHYLTGEELVKYKTALGGTIAFEYICWGLTKENSDKLSVLFRDMNISFFRYDDRQGDASIQADFIKNTPEIKLLTSRMTRFPFKIGDFVIPQNFVDKNDISAENEKSYPPTFSSKLKIKFRELIRDIWFNIKTTVEKDSNDMIIRELPKKMDNDTISNNLAFDVGAYTGTSLKRLRALGFDYVICFEPSKNTFVRLYRKYRNDKKVSFVNRAVSNTDNTKITFYENRETPTLNTTNIDWYKIPHHKNLVNKIHKRTVKTITLNKVIKIIDRIPSYIKIDVEGYELSVLNGMNFKSDLLSFEWISERKDKNIETLNKVRELGYTKFVLTFEEALPEFNPENELDFDSVIKKWKVMEDDGQNIHMWGNIWCK